MTARSAWFWCSIDLYPVKYQPAGLVLSFFCYCCCYDCRLISFHSPDWVSYAVTPGVKQRRNGHAPLPILLQNSDLRPQHVIASTDDPPLSSKQDDLHDDVTGQTVRVSTICTRWALKMLYIGIVMREFTHTPSRAYTIGFRPDDDIDSVHDVTVAGLPITFRPRRCLNIVTG